MRVIQNPQELSAKVKLRFFFCGRSRKSKSWLVPLKPSVVNVVVKSEVNRVPQEIQIFFP